MKEIVIISGKDDAGKTFLATSFAVLAGRVVVCDCNVYAPEMRIILEPTIKEKHEFIAGHKVFIQMEECSGCGKCFSLCRFDAVHMMSTDDNCFYFIDPIACRGCGVCYHFCPYGAVGLVDNKCGEWFVSDTRVGPMVHGEINEFAEKPRNLISLIRQKAREIAREGVYDFLISDGLPWNGASGMTTLCGADQVLYVAEPTFSSLHDVDRVIDLAAELHIPISVCVNKWDLDAELTETVEKRVMTRGVQLLGRIRYDSSVTKLRLFRRTIIDWESPLFVDVIKIWESLVKTL